MLCAAIPYTAWIFAGGELKGVFGFVGIAFIISYAICVGMALERLSQTPRHE